MNREFRLAPSGSGRGISCDASGAFFGNVPLLKRTGVDGDWEPRDCAELSEQIETDTGLPIDMTAKMGGLGAISHALNEGDIARAQIATVLLGIPDPLSNGPTTSDDLLKFVRDLAWSGLLKRTWDPNKHPKWPAGAPDSQGGKFSPVGNGATTNARDPSRRGRPGRKSEEECERQLDADSRVCGNLEDKRDRAICRSSAMERYAACLRGKPMPPLTLPTPDYDFQPLPVAPPRHYSLPATPPWWFFLPLVLPAAA